MLYRLERHDMFDMVPVLYDNTILVARPTPLDMDLGLVTRPYRPEAWALVGVTLGSMLAFSIFPAPFTPNFYESVR